MKNNTRLTARRHVNNPRRRAVHVWSALFRLYHSSLLTIIKYVQFINDTLCSLTSAIHTASCCRFKTVYAKPGVLIVSLMTSCDWISYPFSTGGRVSRTFITSVICFQAETQILSHVTVSNVSIVSSANERSVSGIIVEY